ncbi:MAG: 50S ribosomal protein L13 [Ignavibacteria bacterium]|nr:50S ribosomal protein L13 [Ignavibacteria bacterium]
MKESIKKSVRITKFAKREENPNNWYVVDADGKVLGRLASEIAKRIRGKYNPQFTPNSDVGDWVIVINADKVRLTGKRAELKDYKTHSRYPGGQRIRSYKEVFEATPEKVIQLAVKRMLPKTKLGSTLINKLKVYKGTEHPHTAQKPVALNIL